MELMKSYQELPQSVKDKLAGANMFFSHGYSEYISSTGGNIWYLYDDEWILPVHVQSKAAIRFGACPSEPFCLSNPCDSQKEKRFINQVSDLLKKNGLAWFSTAATAFFCAYPDNSMRIPFGSHVLDLSMTEDELLAKMHSKHRNVVKRAEKSNVQVKCGGLELLQDYLLMDEATWARSGRHSYGEKFFTDMFENMPENVIFYIAYKDDAPQAGACYFYNSVMCYYMFGASIDKPETGATNFMHWQAMKDLKKKGVKRYSFVGCRINEDEDSKYHTIQRFKERFGGDLIQGYMFKSVLNPWKYQMFHWLYKLKNKHALTDAVDQEIHKWQELQKS